ncbi:MAG: glycosyltransferase [Chloroflexi bacterium]|nr:glycosyltransferase [Chloroflexota bacterium]
MMIIVETLYALTSILLALYGFNSLYLLWLYRRAATRVGPPMLDVWPRVTVQLPLFNELHTVERLISAVAALDYPRHLLEVQVLDDSTDATTELAASLVARAQVNGLNIVHLHRAKRDGYKAGALAAGLTQAQGEFIAIFDADFVPPPDFLRRALPWFADPRAGCVQARWSHLNRNYSLLTQLQALGVDGHFVVEQTARARNGLFLNFNGTGGVWRRACIEDAGGWQGDTLTEDLDLSYRAQLKNWRIEFLPNVTVPAELPAQMTAYKNQQARWAKGSLQTARKLLWPLLRSPQPLAIKLEGALHLTAYLVHPLILLVMILSLPISFSNSPMLRWIPLLMISAVGPPLLFLAARTADGPTWPERLKLIPGLILLGIGLSLNNSNAALAGLLLPGRGAFQRTPKFAVRHSEERWEHSGYALKQDRWVWGEMAAGVFAVWCAFVVGLQGRWGFVPWLVVYVLSFGYVAAVTVIQSAGQRAQQQAVNGQVFPAPHEVRLAEVQRIEVREVREGG